MYCPLSNSLTDIHPKASKPYHRKPSAVIECREPGSRLLGLEEEDGAVTKVKVYEVLCLVRNEAAKVASYDTMPCRSLALVELRYVSCEEDCGDRKGRTVFLMCCAMSCGSVSNCFWGAEGCGVGIWEDAHLLDAVFRHSFLR
jgi:hypothetical protein